MVLILVYYNKSDRDIWGNFSMIWGNIWVWFFTNKIAKKKKFPEISRMRLDYPKPAVTTMVCKTFWCWISRRKQWYIQLLWIKENSKDNQLLESSAAMTQHELLMTHNRRWGWSWRFEHWRRCWRCMCILLHHLSWPVWWAEIQRW